MNRKIPALTMVLPILSACSVSTTVTTTCDYGSSSGVNCSSSVAVTVAQKNGTTSNTLDVDDLVFDLGASTVPVTSSSGVGTVVADLAIGGSVSQSFVWIKQGSTLVAQDPTSVNQWIASLGDVTNFSVSFGSYSVASDPGPNTITGEVKYQGVILGGSSTSWYDDCGGQYYNCELQ